MFFVLVLNSLMVVMYFFNLFLFSVSMVCGVLVIGNSLCVVLLMFMLVVCVDSVIVISSLNGVLYFSFVCGCGLSLCRCVNILIILVLGMCVECGVVLLMMVIRCCFWLFGFWCG